MTSSTQMSCGNSVLLRSCTLCSAYRTTSAPMEWPMAFTHCVPKRSLTVHAQWYARCSMEVSSSCVVVDGLVSTTGGKVGVTPVVQLVEPSWFSARLRPPSEALWPAPGLPCSSMFQFAGLEPPPKLVSQLYTATPPMGPDQPQP